MKIRIGYIASLYTVLCKSSKSVFFCAIQTITQPKFTMSSHTLLITSRSFFVVSVASKQFFLLQDGGQQLYSHWQEKCRYKGGSSANLAAINNAEEQKMVDDLLRRSDLRLQIVLTGMRIDMKNVTGVVNYEKKVLYS